MNAQRKNLKSAKPLSRQENTINKSKRDNLKKILIEKFKSKYGAKTNEDIISKEVTQFLLKEKLNDNDFKNLDELRISLISYVNSYNQRVHSSLNGLSPQDRFFKESHIIKRLTSEQIETSFLLEYERRVSADNVVMINETEYEVDYRYSKQKIILRYSPDLSKAYVVDKNTGELTEIKLLNKHDNSLVKRKKVKLSGGNK